MDSFIPLTESAVGKLIGCSPKKSCMFDPMSTPMVISCADVLLPLITKMVNLSLNSGEFGDFSVNRTRSLDSQNGARG